jgi:hypothetical protein
LGFVQATGLEWGEHHLSYQVIAAPESARAGEKEDKLCLAPHVEATTITWDADVSQAPSGIRYRATLRDVTVVTVEPGDLEPRSRAVETRGSWFAFLVMDGRLQLDSWRTSKKPDDEARRGIETDFQVLVPSEPGLQDLAKRKPGEEWVLSGADAVRLYRFDLPHLGSLKTAEARVWVQGSGPGPDGVATVALKAVIRSEIEYQGRKILRTGSGSLVYDADRGMLRSYDFRGDVHFTVPLENRSVEMDGQWTCNGIRRFRK